MVIEIKKFSSILTKMEFKETSYDDWNTNHVKGDVYIGQN